MTTCKIILTCTNKQQKICHALAITSAFNLKLCLKALVSISVGKLENSECSNI